MTFAQSMEAPRVRPAPYVEVSCEQFLDGAPVGAVMVPAAYVTRAEILWVGTVAAATVSIEGHKQVAMWRITFPKKRFKESVESLLVYLRNKFETSEIPVIAECRHKDRMYPVVLMRCFKGIFDLETNACYDAESGNDENSVNILMLLASQEYGTYLDRLAQLMGRNVRYHAFRPEGMNPYTTHPDDIHLVPFAAPPGCSAVARNVLFLFGYRTTVDGKPLHVAGKTLDRGILAVDSTSDTPIGQVLGNTWYMLFPSLTVINRSTSGLIFRAALELMWATVRAHKPVKAKPMTSREFVETCTEVFKEIPTLIDRRLEALRENVVEAREMLANALAEQALHQKAADRLKAGTFGRVDQGAFRADWHRICSHPLVNEVRVGEGNALLIQTHALVVGHEGKRYDIGPLFIRIGFTEITINVWSESSRHPKHVPHPHVSKEGGPCFGSASAAIAEAHGTFRVGDLVMYILRSLQDGYEPTLAAYKIEEWPEVGGET